MVGERGEGDVFPDVLLRLTSCDADGLLGRKHLGFEPLAKHHAGLVRGQILALGVFPVHLQDQVARFIGRRIDDRDDREAALGRGIERETRRMAAVTGDNFELEGQGVLDRPHPNRRFLAVRRQALGELDEFGIMDRAASDRRRF